MPWREKADVHFGPFQFSKPRLQLLKCLSQPIDGRSMAYNKHKLSISKQLAAKSKAKAAAAEAADLGQERFRHNTLLYCHSCILLYCYTIILLYFYNFTLLHCYTFILLHVMRLYFYRHLPTAVSSTGQGSRGHPIQETEG